VWAVVVVVDNGTEISDVLERVLLCKVSVYQLLQGSDQPLCTCRLRLVVGKVLVDVVVSTDLSQLRIFELAALQCWFGL